VAQRLFQEARSALPHHTRPSPTIAPPQQSLWPTRPERRWLLALLSTSLALRIVLILALRTYHVPDKGHHYLFAAEYGRIAYSLATGKGYASCFALNKGGPTINGVPFFPFFLSLLFRIFGIYSPGAALALLVCNSVALMITTLFIFMAGKRLFGPTVAWLAAIIISFDPTALWYAINCTWETALSTTALAMPPVIYLWLQDRPTTGRGIVAGITAGLCAHLNAAVLPVNALLALWLLIRSTGHRIAIAKCLAATAVAAAICIAPWSVRNSLVTGKPVLLRGGGEIPLYVGNHSKAFGDHRDVKTAYLVHNQEERQLYYSMGEPAYLRRCAQLASQFIRSQPLAYTHLVIKRAVFFWLGDFWTAPQWQGSLNIPFSLVRIKQAGYILPAVFALAGFLVAIHRRALVWPLTCQIVAYSTPFILVFCGVMRYRVPIHGSLILFSAIALEAAWHRLHHNHPTPTASEPTAPPSHRG